MIFEYDMILMVATFYKILQIICLKTIAILKRPNIPPRNEYLDMGLHANQQCHVVLFALSSFSNFQRTIPISHRICSMYRYVGRQQQQQQQQGDDVPLMAIFSHQIVIFGAETVKRLSHRRDDGCRRWRFLRFSGVTKCETLMGRVFQNAPDGICWYLCYI